MILCSARDIHIWAALGLLVFLGLRASMYELVDLPFYSSSIDSVCCTIARLQPYIGDLPLQTTPAANQALCIAYLNTTSIWVSKIIPAPLRK